MFVRFGFLVAVYGHSSVDFKHRWRFASLFGHPKLSVAFRNCPFMILFPPCAPVSGQQCAAPQHKLALQPGVLDAARNLFPEQKS
jgi:hypothetical protein